MSQFRKAIQEALIETSPVMAGYIVVGFAFGLLLQTNGYSVGWAIAMSILIYSGSMQFITISFLSGAFGWPQIILISLAMNIRHMVYGLSFIESFYNMGKKRFYMIYSLTDETYSLLCSQNEKNQHNKTLYFLISFLNQCYWIIGAVVGSIMGNVITINTTGIEFAMTALFLVSFLDQVKHSQNRKSALIGLVFSLFALIVFEKNNLILPALIGIIGMLLISRPKETEVTSCQ